MSSSSFAQGHSRWCRSWNFFFTAADFCRAGNMGSRYTTSGRGSALCAMRPSSATLSTWRRCMRATMGARRSSRAARASASSSSAAITGFASQRTTSKPAAASRKESSPRPAVASKTRAAGSPFIRATFTSSSPDNLSGLMRGSIAAKSAHSSMPPPASTRPHSSRRNSSPAARAISSAWVMPHPPSNRLSSPVQQTYTLRKNSSSIS